MVYSFDFNAIDQIPFEKYDQNFTFIVDGKQYHTCRILADLLSPTIRHFHQADSTTTSFTITTANKFTPNANNGKDYFAEFLYSIQNHKAVSFNDESREYYKSIFKSLGNDHEYSKFEPLFNSSISVENVFERVDILNGFYTNIQYSENLKHPKCQDELDFISGHFYELDKEKMKKLNEDQLLYVLKSEKLQIEDEDSLLSFVLEMYESDHSHSHLFEHVVFSNVSVDKMCEFTRVFDIDDVNGNVWLAICGRLNRKVAEDEARPGRYHASCGEEEKKIEKELNNKSDVVAISRVQGNEFNGIFKYLTEKSGGNIHENKTIEITSNIAESKDYPFRNIVDFNTDNFYDSQESNKLHTVTFDFKSRQVKVTSYTIKSPDKDPDSRSAANYHMKSWFIEASKDGQNWEAIDHQENCSTLKGRLVTASFNTQMNDFCRYIRYRQADTNWGNDYFLTINSLEFYGSIKDELGFQTF